MEEKTAYLIKGEYKTKMEKFKEEMDKSKCVEPGMPVFPKEDREDEYPKNKDGILNRISGMNE